MTSFPTAHPIVIRERTVPIHSGCRMNRLPLHTGLLFVMLVLIPLMASCVYGKKAHTPAQGLAATPPDILKSAATLGQDDVFEVRVFGEKELSNIYRISDRGTISFPLIGEVKVDGLTPSQIEATIQSRLEKDFLNQAFVSVFVKEFNSKKIFVFGQVQKPGTFRYEENMTIIQAITLAGGFTKTAGKNSVSVTRLVEQQERRIDVEIEQIWKGKAPNLVLQAGDIIFIPETLF